MSKVIAEKTSGNVKITCWESYNQKFNKNDYNYTIKKFYKTQSGEWKNTDFFNLTDLYDAQNLIQSVLQSRIKKKEKQQLSAPPPAQQTPKMNDPWENEQLSSEPDF